MTAMKTSASLDFLFHPQSIAIAGVSENVNKFNFGLRYLQGLQEFGYPGKLYPLNPAGGEVNGMTLYKSLREIPGGRLHHFRHSRPLYAAAGR